MLEDERRRREEVSLSWGGRRKGRREKCKAAVLTGRKEEGRERGQCVWRREGRREKGGG